MAQVSKRLRFEVFRRDNFTCRYCGRGSDSVELTIDHLVPASLGGSDDPSNLVTACRDCNTGKAATSPDEPLTQQVAEDALRWERAKRVAAAEQAQHREDRDAYIAALDAAWRTWSVDGELVPRPQDWIDSTRHFFALGLEIDVAVDLVGSAMRRNGVRLDNVWRYFCGACWNTLKQRDEIAARMVDGSDEPDHAPARTCSYCGEPRQGGSAFAVPNGLFGFDSATVDGYVCRECLEHLVWQFYYVLHPAELKCDACGNWCDNGGAGLAARTDFKPLDVMCGQPSWVCDTCYTELRAYVASHTLTGAPESS